MKPNVNGEDAFVHRTVSATAAQPVATAAANSVFSLAGREASTPPEYETLKRSRRTFDTDRLIKTFASCGELSVPQVQSAMACARSVAHRQVKLLLTNGRIVPGRKDGRAQLYKLAPPRGFKAHLAREAGMREANVKSAPPAVQAVDPKELREFTEELAGAADGLQCALFNTGHLLIEIGDRSVRLSGAQARALVVYLDQIATALQAA